jgi:photosystem II stability/assembly factor-like uncharacterized protein
MKRIFCLFLLLSASVQCVFAHVPHDEIYDVVASSNPDNANLYGIIRSNLMKSNDKGVTWRRITRGLDNKSKFQHIAIDPRIGRRLYLSTAVDGVYLSDDGGYSWRKNNAGLDTLSLDELYVPATQGIRTAFAAGTKNGLYKFTSDTGRWVKVYGKPAPITAISGLNATPSVTSSVLIGDRHGVLSRSNDGGQVWQKVHQFTDCGDINTIGTSPLLADTFWVGTGRCGMFRTTDGGLTFSPMNSGISDLNIRSIALSPSYATDQTVFASTWSQAIFISSDGGASWRRVSENLTTTEQADKQKKPHFSHIALSANFQKDGTLFLCGFDGLFRSLTRGEHWEQVPTLPVDLIQGLAVSPDYASDATLAITTYQNGIYKSSNAGKSWQAIASDIAKRNYDIAFSPDFATDGMMFASTAIGNNQVGKSTDRGATWQKITLPFSDDPTLFALSPQFASDATMFVGSRNGRIYRSTTHGNAFDVVFSEVFDQCNGCVSSLVTSPNYQNDHSVFAATKKAIHMSEDGGNTWQAQPDPYHLFGSSIKGDHVKLAVSPNYALDQQIFITGLEGLFLTTDRFKTWQKLMDGYITAIALSPDYQHDQSLIVSVKGKGAFKSTNGGLSFKALNPSLLAAHCSLELWDEFPEVSSSVIKFSPDYAHDKTIFAACSASLARSRDAGKTWHRFAITTD